MLPSWFRMLHGLRAVDCTGSNVDVIGFEQVMGDATVHRHVADKAARVGHPRAAGSHPPSSAHLISKQEAPQALPTRHWTRSKLPHRIHHLRGVLTRRSALQYSGTRLALTVRSESVLDC